ncbi:hypothetical protein V7S43_008309 [Phytophthora oleae]|uniref:DUF659 domain-containing protein n=1 Tax=Phytophthora oleae TaxID=2107226 RepID=A0ABD3FLJ1_9STRA
MARFTLSDTASAARKVSRQFDSTLQTDCTMHALNLCIGYGIGLKENVRNEYVADPTTNVPVKKKLIVTKGGALSDGGKLIRKLRTLNNFFSSSRSSERIARRKQVQTFHRLPELAAVVDIDVRVASTIKLFRRSIVNYAAFQPYFQNASESDAQLEAVLHRIAELALVESQSATILPSTMYVLLRVASARVVEWIRWNEQGSHAYTRRPDTA